jgi:hypothetical protein
MPALKLSTNISNRDDPDKSKKKWNRDMQCLEYTSYYIETAKLALSLMSAEVKRKRKLVA